MRTGSREDYLKAVYLNNENNIKTSNKDLAAMFNISAASVSEMMKKLTELGHLKKDTGLGYVLSEESQIEAQALIRKHRLWEVFFVEKLKLNWGDVHEDAEILEHATSNLIEDHLNEFLGYPQYCPHGSVIYGNGGKKNLLPLGDMVVGQSGTLTKVKDSKELLEYLEDIDLGLNTKFKLVKVEPYEGNLHIETKDRIIFVSNKASLDLYIGDIS